MLAAALDMGLDFRSPQPTMRGLDFGAQPTIRTQWDSLACRPESLVYDGRLEIFHAGEWGTFCTRSFGLNDAWVACGQMGLEPYVVDRSDCRFYLKAERRGSGKIWLSHMKCYGDEEMLSQCGSTQGDPFSGSRGGLVWGAPDCQEDHSEDLGISCLAPNGETPRVLSGEGAVRFGWMQTRTAGARNDPIGGYKPCRAAREATEVNSGLLHSARTCAETCLGSALLLGVRIIDNFRSPYLSASIGEFWSRWHISLSTWFRDYLYIPLGGNRVALPRWALNTMIVFMVSGLWHGASWTFVAWGALHGLLLLAERFFKPLISVDKVGTALRHLLVIKTFVLTSLIWIFFRAENFEKAEAIFRALTAFNTGLFNSTTYYLAAGSASLLLLGDIWLKGARMDQKLSAQPLVIRWTLYTVLIFGLLAFAGTEKFAFIYFQF